jgi:hypothetical protein
MRARLGGREVDMTESASPSSRTDAGCGDDSLESGLGGIGVGECPRRCALGILPGEGGGVSGKPTTTNGPRCRSSVKRDFVWTEMTGSSFSSFLPIQHDGGAATTVCRLLGLRRLAGPIASKCVAAHSVQCRQPPPFARKRVPVTGQPITSTGSREGAASAGEDPGGFRSGPSRRVVGNRVSGCGCHATGAAGCRWWN